MSSPSSGASTMDPTAGTTTPTPTPSSSSSVADPTTTPSSTPSTTSPTITSQTSTSTPPSSSTPTTSTTTPSTSTPSSTSTPTSSTSTSTTSSSETSTTAPSTTSTPPSTSSSSSPSQTPTPTEPTDPSSTETTTITSTAQAPTHATTSSSVATGTPTLLPGQSGHSSSNLDKSGKIAVAVVVPIAGVALLVLAGLFFWRKRKQRKIAEEQRRKEAEDYAYNPNNDPTFPDVGAAGSYEMKGDRASGYRGWGSTTLASSTGRKGSTTMSGGQTGVPYSDANTVAQGDFSDARSGEPLMSDGSHSPEGEILGAMGPSSADNRGGLVHRGPSNASSSYSAAGRSDGSGEGVGYGGPGYYDQYGSNPYSDPYADSQNAQVQPIIRDNPARRNTRIESPSHYPQQSAGISQNF